MPLKSNSAETLIRNNVLLVEKLEKQSISRKAKIVISIAVITIISVIIASVLMFANNHSDYTAADKQQISQVAKDYQAAKKGKDKVSKAKAVIEARKNAENHVQQGGQK